MTGPSHYRYEVPSKERLDRYFDEHYIKPPDEVCRLNSEYENWLRLQGFESRIRASRNIRYSQGASVRRIDGENRAWYE